MVLTGDITMQCMNKKKTKGRKKIEIKKIEENNSRQVTFSKRRTGLFKKASELCILTGAQVAILVSSPGGRVYSFGHPNADSLVDRYLNGNNTSSTNTVTTTTIHNNNNNDDNNNNINNNNNITATATTTTSNSNINYNNNKNYTITTTHNNNSNSSSNNNCLPPLPMKEFNEHYVEVTRELEAEKKRREMIPTSSSSGGIPWFEAGVDGMEVEELEQYLRSLMELKNKVLTRADELVMINKAPPLLGGGSSVFDMWGSGAVNAAVNGGFVFQHGGETGMF